MTTAAVMQYHTAHESLEGGPTAEQFAAARKALDAVKVPHQDRVVRFFCRFCGSMVHVDHGQLDTSRPCCQRHKRAFLAKLKRRIK